MSGRTTRMMEEALKSARAGKKVLVVVAYEDFAKRLRAQYHHENLTIESAAIALRPESTRGRKFEVTFQDHYIR